jgi:hypothetical protein
MIEYHGWVIIRDHFNDLDQDIDEDKMNGIVGRIRERIRPSINNEYYDLRTLNGSFHLTIDAAHNHRSDEPIEFFKWIADISLGSYGLLYVYDDEDHKRGNENKFKVWRMKKGQVDELDDVYLSPYFPTVEDPS